MGSEKWPKEIYLDEKDLNAAGCEIIKFRNQKLRAVLIKTYLEVMRSYALSPIEIQII